VEEKKEDARQPDEDGQGVLEEDLAEEKAEGGVLDVFKLAGVAHELEGRPAVGRVPDEVREKEKRGQAAAEPEEGAFQPGALSGQEEPDPEPEEEEEDRSFILQSQAGDEAEDEPEPGAARPDDGQEDEQASLPEQDVEKIHRKNVEHEVAAGRGEGGRGGQGHGPAPAAEFSGHQGGEEDESRPPQGGQETEGEERIAKQEPDELEEEDGERRLVDVPPGQMFAAGEVVKLVPEVPEPSDGDEMEDETRGREQGGRPKVSDPVFSVGRLGHGSRGLLRPRLVLHPVRLLPPGLKKRQAILPAEGCHRQGRTAAAGENLAEGAVVEPGPGRVFGRAAEKNPSDPGPEDGRQAHRAGLAGRVKDAIRQVEPAELSGRPAEGDDFGVGRRVVGFEDAVVAPPGDATALDNDRPERPSLRAVHPPPRFPDCQEHKIRLHGFHKSFYYLEFP